MKVFVATNPLTYHKDIKFHTNADCFSFRKADPRYKKSMDREKAEKLYRYCRCCENKDNK